MLNRDQLQQFQQQDWRQQSKVFRQAIDVTQYEIDPLDLCELATDDLVESRLIGNDHALTLGPFEFEPEDDSPEKLLPDKAMLLVQCLEQHLNQIDDLIRTQFAFMPRWQIDDVMASLGNTDASCGAHFDQYDVFLIQHTGTKVWQLDDGGHDESDLADDVEIRLLSEFKPTQTFTLNPGDVLYVPPGVGHHGICPELSMTLSVGIRHPTPAELLAEISEFALDQLAVNSPMTSNLYEHSMLPQDAVQSISHQLNDILNPSLVNRWYGTFVTRLREPELVEDYALQAPESLRWPLTVTLPTRLAWSLTSDSTLFFANGEVFELPVEDQHWVKQLCEARALELNDHPISDAGMTHLESLLMAGALTHSFAGSY